jgi:hypothetical protein
MITLQVSLAPKLHTRLWRIPSKRFPATQPPLVLVGLGPALGPGAAGQLAAGERGHGDAGDDESSRNQECYDDLTHGFPPRVSQCLCRVSDTGLDSWLASITVLTSSIVASDSSWYSLG